MIATRPKDVDVPTIVPKPAGRRSFRVLKIAPTSFFSDYGCHVRILEETLALQALGSRVTICTYHSGGNVPGLDIRRSLGWPGRNRVHVGSSPYRFLLDGLLSARALLASAQVRPDVIHAHLHEGALIGGLLSRLWRVPLVFDFQGSLTSEMIDHGFLGLTRQSRLYGPLRRLETMIDGLPDVVLTSSHNAANVLTREFGYPVEKVRPLPDCVNTERFLPRWRVAEDKKRQLRTSLGIPAERRLVVYLGLLAEYQGSGHLLRAAAAMLSQHQDIHFLLMGFPGQERYQQMASDLGIADHVTFTGRLPYQLAPEYLALGDLAVSPKMSETEGNGKLLNYMAVGLPTVTFATPVSQEILGELGVFAAVGDHLDLASKMDLLLYAGAEAAEDLGCQLRHRAVERFSWHEAGLRLLAIYESLGRGRKNETTVDTMADGVHTLG
ncbi:MAG: glycosyltransferase family 4 protein [Chloroflexi bacterium]|nr:glycosyltransferase family 4 protein [Chloroflexota bacterium]MCL5107513.1 glycosyltransferase family 4 protein [Chloroflexota bacterium]